MVEVCETNVDGVHRQLHVMTGRTVNSSGLCVKQEVASVPRDDANMTRTRRGIRDRVDQVSEAFPDVFHAGRGDWQQAGSEGLGLNVREAMSSPSSQARRCNALSGETSRQGAAASQQDSPVTHHETDSPVADVPESRVWWWRRDARPRWMLVRSFLLARLRLTRQAISARGDRARACFVGLLRALRVGLTPCWTFLTRGMPGMADFIRSRLRLWRSTVRLQMLRERRKGGFWGCARAFCSSSRDGLAQCCRELWTADKDCHLQEDVVFLLSEHRARAVVLVLFFVFSVLLELLAASSLDSLVPPPCPVHSLLILSDTGFSQTMLPS